MVDTRSSFPAANYVAVLGFAEPVNTSNQSAAYHVGRLLAESGFSLLCGNTSSTFSFALKGAAEAGGLTQVILEQVIKERVPADHPCYLANDAATKHRLLAEHSEAAIVIGGGPKTLTLVERLIKLKRPVVAISGTGGVVRRELSSRVLMAENATEAIALIQQRLAL